MKEPKIIKINGINLVLFLPLIAPIFLAFVMAAYIVTVIVFIVTSPIKAALSLREFFAKAVSISKGKIKK